MGGLAEPAARRRPAPDDPPNPARWSCARSTSRSRSANALGIRVLLMPYRFPRWANGTRGRPTRGPRGQALAYRLPDDAYGPDSAWAGFFAFLYDRYTPAARPARASKASSSSTSRTCSCGRSRGSRARSRGCSMTAQGISARHAHSTMLSRRRSATTTRRRASATRAGTSSCPRCSTSWRRSATWRTPARPGRTTTTPTSSGAGRRRTPRRSGRCSPAAGPATRARAPTVFITEGGARLSRMADALPAEDRAGPGALPAGRVGAADATTAPGPAWRCSPSTCSTPTPTSTAACSTPIRVRETPGL